ncbi:host specificity factor TipJ family phage tail protein [Acinetobacter sichuanensis]|uniref:host specificity factor TipJ family phage tail protein n=1 Tax=Acinetobacter sichuanensis TaxID=2136183 RepID=UPI00280DDC78|nr:host specificity factor TipJ family phage tail protein [Acinetobacter sichuanensis]MDQ9022677.1 host specificity factor TipJ family phage tail protein [Acinetobacter sichuanensis]
MKRLHIIPNTFDQNTWSVEEVDDVLVYLKQQFTVLPENTRIYHNSIAPENDVTPIDERGVRNLQALDGDIYVVIEPGYDPFTIAYLVIAAITLAFSVYTYMTMPKPQNQSPQSPNNDLASRQNQIRLNGRIPDIYGTLLSYPDLISVTYTFYNEKGIEVERSLLCIGRGYYQIHNMKDAETEVSDIPGTSISVYDPFTDITGTPIYKNGRTFTDTPLAVAISDSITGQVLNAPNKPVFMDFGYTYFTLDGYIRQTSGSFATDIQAGDSIVIYGATIGTPDFRFSGNILLKTNNSVIFETTENISSLGFENLSLNGALIELEGAQPDPEEPKEPNFYRDFSGVYNVTGVSKSTIAGGFQYTVNLSNPVNENPSWQYLIEDKTVNAGLQLINNRDAIHLDDEYVVEDIGSDYIKLVDPELVNPEWSFLTNLPNQNSASIPLEYVISKLDPDAAWVGWHNIFMPDAEFLYVNIHFPNGLYRQNSKGGTSEDWTTGVLEYQHIDADGVPFGQVYTVDLHYTNATRVPFGDTKIVPLLAYGSVRFRLCRTRTDIANNVQAEMRVKDVYLAKRSDKINYGNMTVIQSEAVGNDGLYSIKERKLNCLVTRKLKVDGVGALTPTNSAEQALIDLALDEYIGRRSMNELDVVQMKAEVAKIIAYFKSDKAAEFSYTIDDPNLSFEEIAGMVASTVFCEPNRFGSKIQLQLEQPQENAVLLFNHRNKVPKSEKRTESWGVKNKYDGVEIEYTSPVDDTRVKYIASEKANPTNLMSIKSTGIRNEAQAKTRAWREWNKIKYQETSVQFDALDESEILLRNDKIIVADNTSVETQDGEVVEVDGLVLVLSQDVVFEINQSYKVYLQLENGSVDMIDCTATEWTNEITLTRPPQMPLVTEDGKYIKTTYQIVKAQEVESSAFMLTEISPQGIMTNSLTCVNYTDKYYEKDHSFF